MGNHRPSQRKVCSSHRGRVTDRPVRIALAGHGAASEVTSQCVRGSVRRLEAILAPEDESIDAVETERILAGLIAQGRDIPVRLYPGCVHAMRRRGDGDGTLRWPAQPHDYHDGQADFIRDETSSARRGTLPLACPAAASPAACRLQP